MSANEDEAFNAALRRLVKCAGGDQLQLSNAWEHALKLYATLARERDELRFALHHSPAGITIVARDEDASR